MFKKISVIALSLILIIIGYELIRRNVGGFGGAYPFAETWTVNKSEKEIEYNLNKLHKKNPEAFLDANNLILQVDRTGYWKKIDFFYADRNEIVQVLIREFDNYTSISLVSFVNKSSGETRLMNKDFTWFENRKEKEIFESRILKYL